MLFPSHCITSEDRGCWHDSFIMMLSLITWLGWRLPGSSMEWTLSGSSKILKEIENNLSSHYRWEKILLLVWGRCKGWFRTICCPCLEWVWARFKSVRQLGNVHNFMQQLTVSQKCIDLRCQRAIDFAYFFSEPCNNILYSPELQESFH